MTDEVREIRELIDSWIAAADGRRRIARDANLVMPEG
jgi:hypothetical protein